MANTTLLALIASGRLAVGTKLHHPARLHADRGEFASVMADGIRVRGRTFATPSGAAVVVTGGKPADGWLFWKLPDGKALDSLRVD